MLPLLFFLIFHFCGTAICMDQTHESWTAVLKKYQDNRGLINYKRLKKDLKSKDHRLINYLGQLLKVEKSEFDKWTKEDQKAFLINAYNAFTVKLIVDHYPVKSIKDIGGFFTKPWDIEFFSLLGGGIKTLDVIEHDWLRPHYKDFRIHAAVNCASISCPPLRNEAFVGSKIEHQLDEQMRLWLANPSLNVFKADGTIKLSKLFDWYSDDFVDWGGGVTQVLAKYAPESAKKILGTTKEYSFLSYNWGLNKQ